VLRRIPNWEGSVSRHDGNCANRLPFALPKGPAQQRQLADIVSIASHDRAIS
jgi:hypothetical protein